MPMSSYVEGNYGINNFQHGFSTNKMKKNKNFVVNEDVQYVIPCMNHKIQSLAIIKKLFFLRLDF